MVLPGLPSLTLANVRLMFGPSEDLGALSNIKTVRSDSDCSDNVKHDGRTTGGKHELFTGKNVFANVLGNGAPWG